MAESIADLEARLDAFDRAERDRALDDLLARVRNGRIPLPAPEPKVNLHAHSFYSFNAMGYSPTHIVWRARREGLRAVGLVDFDLFDGADEFHRAGRLLGIPTVAGLETRAYIPEFADREINSPGEPGIVYHMVTGVAGSSIEDPWAREFADMLRTSARRRNESVVERVNAHLDPVVLDYETDVLPLSPSGTPTERHLCVAYERKAEAVYPDPRDRARFWADRLDTPADEVADLLADSRRLQALIRRKTMKRGGVGYQEPGPDTFPMMTEVNRFALAVGAIPTATWLDGTRQGEQDIEELLDLHQAAGSAALNVIPDRNWNVPDPDTKETKLANLYDIVERAERRHLPLVVGTEMNAPGQRFVDAFDAPELEPVREAFLHSADVLLGHSAAVLAGEPGYADAQTNARFDTVEEKNAHFADRGRAWREEVFGTA
ncbi:MAG: PHP domain-containing protein [Phycisphaerae bacterium]